MVATGLIRESQCRSPTGANGTRTHRLELYAASPVHARGRPGTRLEHRYIDGDPTNAICGREKHKKTVDTQASEGAMV